MPNHHSAHTGNLRPGEAGERPEEDPILLDQHSSRPSQMLSDISFISLSCSHLWEAGQASVVLKAHPAPRPSELQGSGSQLLLIRRTAETRPGARVPHQRDRRLPPHPNYVTPARARPSPLRHLPRHLEFRCPRRLQVSSLSLLGCDLIGQASSETKPGDSLTLHTGSLSPSSTELHFQSYTELGS